MKKSDLNLCIQFEYLIGCFCPGCRQSRVSDALFCWQYAMDLRQRHLGYTKRLPPVKKGILEHYAFSLIEPIAHNAVAKEIARMKRSKERRLASLGIIDRSRIHKPTTPYPSTVALDPNWAKRLVLRAT